MNDWVPKPASTGAAALEELLDIGSLDELIRSLIERTMLDDGRFEAHEFGRGQHSSASAGGVLIGLGGIPWVADATVAPVVDAVGDLVDGAGVVRGHDAAEFPTITSWTLAQVLLGMLTRPHLIGHHRPKIAALARRIADLQDTRTGGWPLREGEDCRLLFSFYPTLALSRASRVGDLPKKETANALSMARSFIDSSIRRAMDSTEEQLLALRALRVISDPSQQSHLTSLTEVVTSRLWDSANELLLQDRSIVVYPQPTWHAVVWRPLLYLACEAPPADPLAARLGDELISNFRKDLGAWLGPIAGARTGTGTSWASALALRATYKLVRDLQRSEMSVSEWRQRCRDLAAESYDFDVALSFAGSERQLAAEISEAIKDAGYRVFYDFDYQHALLGEDLAQYLQETYFRRSRYAVVIVSRAFLASKWAGNWEWKAVLARMQSQKSAYLLPYIVEDVEVPGLNATLGYASRRQFSPSEFARLVIKKLRHTSA